MAIIEEGVGWKCPKCNKMVSLPKDRICGNCPSCGNDLIPISQSSGGSRNHYETDSSSPSHAKPFVILLVIFIAAAILCHIITSTSTSAFRESQKSGLDVDKSITEHINEIKSTTGSTSPVPSPPANTNSTGGSAQTSQGSPRDVVEAWLQAQKRGDSGWEYWTSNDSANFYGRFYAIRSWEILKTQNNPSSVWVYVRVDSSTQGGLQITKVWIPILKQTPGGWKIDLMIDG